MKTLPIITCRSCYRTFEYDPKKDVVEKRWDQVYVVNCVCKTYTRLPRSVIEDLGLNAKPPVEEAPPPKTEEKPVVDKQQRAIDTALAVKKAGSKNQAAKVLGVSPQTVNNYLKWLPADYGTEQ